MFGVVDTTASIVIPGPIMLLVATVVFGLLVMRPVVGIAALLAVYPLLPQVPRPPIPGVNAETVLVSFAMLLTIARSGLRLPPLRIAGVAFAFGAVFLIGWLIGNTWIDFPAENYSVWGRFKSVKSRLFTSLLLFVGYWWAREPDDRRTILEGVSFGCLVIGLGVIGDFVLGMSDRAAGFFFNSNTPGEYLGSFSLATLYLASQRDLTGLRRAVHWGIYGVAVIGVVLTLSRAAWVGIFLGHVAWYTYVNRQMLVAGAVAAMLAATIAYPILPEIVRDRVEDTFTGGSIRFNTGAAIDLEASAGMRTALHLAGFDMFMASPLYGHGNESFFIQSVDYGAKYGVLRRRTPHSLFLKLGTEAGMIGLATLAWLFGALFLTGHGIWKRGGSERRFGALLVAVTAAQFINNLFHTGFLMASGSSSVVWALLGMAARLRFSKIS